jgi:hypothetical protein
MAKFSVFAAEKASKAANPSLKAASASQTQAYEIGVRIRAREVL